MSDRTEEVITIADIMVKGLIAIAATDEEVPVFIGACLEDVPHLEVTMIINRCLNKLEEHRANQ